MWILCSQEVKRSSPLLKCELCRVISSKEDVIESGRDKEGGEGGREDAGRGGEEELNSGEA